MDEDKFLELGSAWMGFGGKAAQHAGTADAHAGQVWADNTGQAIDAFEQASRAKKAPSNSMRSASTASTLRVSAGRLHEAVAMDAAAR